MIALNFCRAFIVCSKLFELMTKRGGVPDAAQRERIHRPLHDLLCQNARSGAPLIRDRPKLEQGAAVALYGPWSAAHHEQRNQECAVEASSDLRCSCCTAPGTRRLSTAACSAGWSIAVCFSQLAISSVCLRVSPLSSRPSRGRMRSAAGSSKATSPP